MSGLTMFRCAILAAALFGAAPSLAHEGHDHGAPPPPVTTTIAPRADASSSEFELVAISRGAEVQIHLDTFKGNQPVIGATVDVDVAGALLSAVPAGDGVYVINAPALAQPGRHDLAITIQTAETIDVLAATLDIPAAAPEDATASTTPNAVSGLMSAPAVQAMADDLRARFAAQDVGLIAVAVASFLAGLVVAAFFGRRRMAPGAPAAALAAGLVIAGLAAPGADAAEVATAAVIAERDLAQRFADGAIFVPKPTQRVLAIRTLFTESTGHPRTIELPGRIIPDPNGAGVVQPSVAGRLLPPDGGFPRLGTRVSKGDVLATVIPAQSAADVTSQNQQKREIEQEIALVEKRLSRWRSIPDAVPRQQVEEAELELDGLNARLESLVSSPATPERLVAPIDGVISAMRAVAGQIAEPNSVIIEIVDPARYWVEALSYEAHALGNEASARFSDDTSIALAYRGTGLAERAQAVTLHFEITGPVEGLRAGQFLTVLAPTAEAATGIAVPRTSVIRSANGQSIVYEHTNAERFVPREVRVEPLDAERVLIVSGVEAGRRIVTQGAELLNQIR